MCSPNCCPGCGLWRAKLLVLFVHDELVPEDDGTVTAVSAAVEEAIADAFRHVYPAVTVTGMVKLHAVSNWAEAK